MSSCGAGTWSWTHPVRPLRAGISVKAAAGQSISWAGGLGISQSGNRLANGDRRSECKHQAGEISGTECASVACQSVSGAGVREQLSGLGGAIRHSGPRILAILDVTKKEELPCDNAGVLGRIFRRPPAHRWQKVFMTGGLGLSTYRQLVSGENLPAQEGQLGGPAPAANAKGEVRRHSHGAGA